ncbi:hypothetical protein [Streptomyces sp. NPDC007205]|uniref:hypothetical protein n=1 Tax=Streptomyces sp. NPDC007205 TaxID=3154316 RepID=UPI0033D8E438
MADALTDGGGTADPHRPGVCFVPSVGAVAVRDIGDQDDLYVKIDSVDPDESELDEYGCSSGT